MYEEKFCYMYPWPNRKSQQCSRRGTASDFRISGVVITVTRLSQLGLV